ncbi:4068_t:CDS:2 [Funneliformis geosporum]|nr:4068_t:CDS:2 [Funneliformis geosporum]
MVNALRRSLTFNVLYANGKKFPTPHSLLTNYIRYAEEEIHDHFEKYKRKKRNKKEMFTTTRNTWPFLERPSTTHTLIKSLKKKITFKKHRMNKISEDGLI